MGEIVPFRKPGMSEIAKWKTLCNSGFHKWVVDKVKQFDVKQGKLVTSYHCKRCGKTKNKSV